MPSVVASTGNTIQVNSNQIESSLILVFEETGKPEYPEKNPSEQGRELSPHVMCSPGVELGTPWCRAPSVLTTAPTLFLHLTRYSEWLRIGLFIFARKTAILGSPEQTSLNLNCIFYDKKKKKT